MNIKPLGVRKVGGGDFGTNKPGILTTKCGDSSTRSNNSSCD